MLRHTGFLYICGMNLKALSIICVFAAFFVSCGAHRDVERRLDEADAMMGCAPDSALAMLESICVDGVDGMGGGQRARYALLLTKAKTKNYKPIEDDSLISFAADYYSGHGDSLEAQSLFYLGYYNAEKRINDKALLHLSHAYDAAFAKGDKFYAAMSAREMSIVYRRLYMVDEGLKWARIAKNLFAEAAKPVHAAWVDNSIADALIYNGRYGDAKILLDSLEHSVYYEDFPFRRSTLINRVTLALQIDSFKEVLDIYDNLSLNGYTFTSHARLNQAKAAIELGMLEEADNYISMARQLRMSDVDSLYERKLLSRLYAVRGDFREAYETASIFGNDVMNSDMRLMRDVLFRQLIVSLIAQRQILHQNMRRRNQLLYFKHPVRKPRSVIFPYYIYEHSQQEAYHSQTYYIGTFLFRLQPVDVSIQLVIIGQKLGLRFC